MKQFYFLLIAVGITVSCFAQAEGASKMYAYKQKVMPGTVRVDINGQEIRRKPQYNYFIYLASTSKVTAVEVWINGEAFAPIVNNVPATPVKYNHPQLEGNLRILVPKTTRIVLQLSPSLNKLPKPSSKGKVLSAKNEVVIIYKGAGKVFYKTVSNAGELAAIHMQ